MEFLGNWDVMGLAGTGSYDYEVPEQTVDEEFTFDLVNAEARRGGPVYRLGVLGLTAAGHAAFALGVGRRGMEELTRIVQTKHRLGADPLRDQQLFRHDYAMHDAALHAARAFVYESFAAVQDVLEAGDDPSVVQRQRLRQATTYATRVATDAVRFAYTAAGTDALRPGVLQRCFRDLHAVDPAPGGRQQHAHRDDPRAARARPLTCATSRAGPPSSPAPAAGSGAAWRGGGRPPACAWWWPTSSPKRSRTPPASSEARWWPWRRDVTVAADVERIAHHAYEAFGAVDVLCNNAGVFQGGLLWECTDADFEWTLGVNLWGILHGIRAFVPRMVAAGTEGHVVNTISMAGLATTPFSGPYDVSKFAAMAATECLAHDLATVGAPIKVSAVCPGLVDTDDQPLAPQPAGGARHRADDGAAFVEQALADGTAGSMSPDEVADLVVEAVLEERFLVPTRPSYAQQLTDRCEDLVAAACAPQPHLRLNHEEASGSPPSSVFRHSRTRKECFLRSPPSTKQACLHRGATIS